MNEKPKMVVVEHKTWGKVSYAEGCSYCEARKTEGDGFFPNHEAPNAGHPDHCSCDRCF